MSILHLVIVQLLVVTAVHGLKSHGDLRSRKEETAILLDGELTDWSLLYRAYPKIWEKPTIDPNFEIFGMHDKASSTYFFAIETTAEDASIGAATTIYLDTDQSSSSATTHGMLDSEYFVNFVNDVSGVAVPHLYTSKGEWLHPVEHKFSNDYKTVEIAVRAADIGGDVGDVDFFVDVNDTKFFPVFFAAPWYTAASLDLPPPTESSNKRVALVFSPESETQLFGGGDVNRYIHRQLYASCQHQLMMAGLPYDLIYVEELKTLETIIRYKALVFPYNAYVLETDRETIVSNLRLAVHHYEIGIITGDNFMTDSVSDGESAPVPLTNPYQSMWEILGVTISGYGAGNITVHASTEDHPVMSGYSAGEQLLEYPKGFYNHYRQVSAPGIFESSSTVTVLAQTHDDSNRHNAVLAIETATGARHVHFGTPTMIADGNLLWQAIRWTVFGDSSPVGLQLSRYKSVFSARNDMDLTMYPDEDLTETLWNDFLLRWKDQFDFVGSYYINIGNNPGAGEYTDWTVSGPLYKEYLDNGNEIGSHSYTHQNNIADLSDEELTFEFLGSQDVLETELGLENVGFAQPGNPESLANIEFMDDVLGLYYISGTYTGVGIGFPSAFGFLTPDANMGFMAPNMFSDFNLLGFKGLTPDEAFAVWTKQFNAIGSHANTPIIHYHWHDYAPYDYSPSLFEDTIGMAYAHGSEFVVCKDLFERMKLMKANELKVSEADGVVTATVSGQGSFGHLALDVADSIESVIDWYAYSDNKVFLPSIGGTFSILKGKFPNINKTRITSLPMRAELLDVAGDGTLLKFSFIGKGAVTVQLNAESADQLEGMGASSTTRLDETTLEMIFDSDEPLKTGSIVLKRSTRLEGNSVEEAEATATEQTVEEVDTLEEVEALATGQPEEVVSSNIVEATATEQVEEFAEKGDDGCGDGRKRDGSGFCVKEWCDDDFQCPANSSRIQFSSGTNLRNCFNNFDDCRCDDGFVKSGGHCVDKKDDGCGDGRKRDGSGYCVKEWCDDDFQCPANSSRIQFSSGTNLRNCFNNFDDCRCDDGFVKSGGHCVDEKDDGCGDGRKRDGSGYCVKEWCDDDYHCPSGMKRKSNRECYNNKDDCQW